VCKCILFEYECRENNYDPYERIHAEAGRWRRPGDEPFPGMGDQSGDRALHDYEEWFIAEVKEALKEVRAGEVVEHEAVMRQWECKRARKMDARR
jgi:hypothetical protein